MRMQEVRAELLDIASSAKLSRGLRSRLFRLAEETKRRRNVRSAPASSRHMTAELRTKVRRYSARYPNKTQFEIAKHFGINQGRVSEALHGKRV